MTRALAVDDDGEGGPNLLAEVAPQRNVGRAEREVRIAQPPIAKDVQIGNLRG